MPITQTGSVTTYAAANANSGVASSSITVPADAELVLVGVGGFDAVANYYSSGSVSFTKGGVSTPMTPVATGANAGDTLEDPQGPWTSMFYLTMPDTGTNKTLSYDWAGSSIPSAYIPILSVIFFKGVDTTSPIRHTTTARNLQPTIRTNTLISATGDLTVAWLCALAPLEGTADTFTNLSLITQVTMSGYIDGAWASASPSVSGPLSLDTSTNWYYTGMTAITLQPPIQTATRTITSSSAFTGVSSLTI